MKKHLSIILTLALVAVLLPAAFAQSSSSSPASQPSQASPSAQTPSSQSPSTESPSTASPSSQSPSSQSPSTTEPSSSSAMGSESSSSFTGTIVKSGDKYVLKSDTGSTYQIDDQDKAKQFEGKQVKVNGSLDKTTSMLHVTDILPSESR